MVAGLPHAANELSQVMSDPLSIHPDVRIGHVHLKVADQDRSLAFYGGVLGFQLTQHSGRAAAFISAGGYENAGARNAYLPHPEHKKFGELLGKLDILHEALVVDFQVGE